MKRERKDKSFIKKPIYPGGKKAMREFIQRELKYPKKALDNKIEGVVRLRITIDKAGAVVKTQVMLHIGYGCDEEAERIARLFKFYVPKNRKIKVHFYKTVNISFKLQKKPAIKFVYKQKPAAEEESSSYDYTINLNA